MPVPFVLPDVREEDIELACKVLRSGYLNEGEFVWRLEEEFAAFTGARYAIAATSGTAALALALMGFKTSRTFAIWPKVAVPSATFYGTAMAIEQALCVVQPYDSTPNDFDFDLVLPVHLSGRKSYPLSPAPGMHLKPVIEDCCHALGCKFVFNGFAACFSFQSEKLIGIGQGGMIITNDDEINRRIRQLKNQGRISRKSNIGGDLHESIGFNSRMTDYQATLALGQLRRVKDKIREKWDAWYEWNTALSCIFDFKAPELNVLPRDCGEVPIWTDVIFKNKDMRETALSTLIGLGIEARRRYRPIHRQPAFQRPDSEFPIASDLADRELWLPNNRLVTGGIARTAAHKLKQALT